MVAIESTPLILFSGLAADANIFVPQKIAFPQLVVPKWPIPKPDDTLDSYCDRLADDLRPYGQAIIGGASFGGIVALHVAQRLNPLAVLLIGSVRSPAELSRVARFCRPLGPLTGLIPVRLLQLGCVPIASGFAGRFVPHLCGLARQFRGSDPTLFKWSLARILDWTSTPTFDCPVFHIHGDRDFVLPMRHTSPGTVVAGGGHVISLTHPSDVNDFIRRAMVQLAGDPTGIDQR
ncbi:alpha/beta hydrolase [Stieleria sp. TO1_6]|uniref:alpha/beta fold hydrolase n=1 Tax=Stieleria tagensis TaxID=2956795 RepID=UPI00209B04A7|nr:alpha/beta hydrolase [Stieleria tagensis]